MQILLLNSDISGSYPFQSVRSDDTDGGEQDACILEASGSLAAQELIQAGQDDFLEVVEDGYTTGRLYVDTVGMSDGITTLKARGLAAKGSDRAWGSFEKVTLMELMHMAAKDLNMGYRQFGITNQKYDRVIRRGETWPELLRRMLRLEGAVLKCADGKLTAISIPWAQAQKPARSFEITPETKGCRYMEHFAACRECIVSGIEVQGKATDTAVQGGRKLKPDTVQPQDGKQAKRWAQGELLLKNRLCREVYLKLSYCPDIASMSRIDLAGMSVTAGQWIAGQVKHDLINKTTQVYLRPCITTIQ